MSQGILYPGWMADEIQRIVVDALSEAHDAVRRHRDSLISLSTNPEIVGRPVLARAVAQAIEALGNAVISDGVWEVYL